MYRRTLGRRLHWTGHPRAWGWVLSGVIGLVCVVASAKQAAFAELATGSVAAAQAPVLPAIAAFDPTSVRLPIEAPESRMLAAIAAGQAQEARRIGEAALPAASAASRGRVLWLLARVDGQSNAERWSALLQSDHPLRRWAGLRLAERIQKVEPQRAQALVASLAHGWAGAERAMRLQAEILASGTPTKIATAAQPSNDPAIELARGKQLLATQRYEDAQALFESLAVKTLADSALSCQVGLELGRAFVYQKQRPKSAEHMLALAARCEDSELKTWARYYAGQAKLRSADPQGAIDALQVLVTEAPSSSLADDALSMQATAYADQGRVSEQVATLEQIVAHYPSSDMRGDASFTLAMLARQRRDFAAALVHLDALELLGVDLQTEGQEGRSTYWRARTLQDLGEKARALEVFADVVHGCRLSFYAQLALGRIDALDKAVAKTLRDELTAAPETPLRFDYRAEMDDSAFIAAIELLRVGETTLALDELKQLGALGAGRDPQLGWLGAALLYESGAVADASRAARSLVRDLPKTQSLTRSRALMRLAYPNAFQPLLEDAAKEASVPATFLRAIAREESSFDPAATSPARAYGLVQLIVPTARTYARPLGLPSDPAALKRPEINLRLGARFLSELFRRYGDFAALVPSAYNAGQGATDRWLKEQKARDLDEWVEAIPYRETRRYTRRVLQSYCVYRWLDNGQTPGLPITLPANL